MRYSKWKYLLYALLILILYSCNATKYIPENEYLLDKVHIKSDNPDYNSLELRTYVRQLPNYKMFGINKTQLQVYNLSGRDSSRWLNRLLKGMGEPPVIFDSTSVDKTSSELTKLFINKGYVNVDVESVIDKKDKKADITYIIRSNEPYKIGQYIENIHDTAISEELHAENNEPVKLPGEPSSLRRPLIKEGMLFDRDILDKERERITNILRNRGYFAFEKDYISYEADSALMNHSVDLKMNLHPYPEILPSGVFAEIPHRKYYFDKVYIYLDYDPLKVTGYPNYQPKDSVVKDNYTIYYKGNSPSIRRSVLINNSFLTPGRTFSQLREEATYSSYATLQAISNVNIHFEEFLRNDSAFLNCHVLTIPAKKQSATFSVEGTNTAGDLGVAASTNLTHRNLFKGSETFNFKLRGAYEAITGFNNPYLEFGADAAIRIPKFIFPFVSSNFAKKMRTSTEFSLSYNYQTRPEYERTMFSGGIHYIWQGRGSTASRHQFDLLDINYVLPNLSPDFIKELPANALYLAYNKQFIVGMGYYYSHSTFDPAHKQNDVHSLRASIESAGNALYALSNMLDFKKNKEGSYQLFGTYYYQFLKGDLDYAKTIPLDKNNSIAWRVGGGIAVPYGNSDMVPFEKRYYSGGANSVRAWSVRELGPGSYHPTDSTTFFNQSGDIKLDLSLEYRTRFFWKLEAAAFVDAGNIWTIKDYEGQEGGKFKFDSFYKEIALGYGLGLRLDYDFFLIRLDAGWKAYNPAKDGKDKWAVLNPNFTNNFAWHVAIGYPF